jgi:hypothetical protein
MVIVDDRGEGQKACGDAVLAVMEKTRREKKRYSGFLARLSISNYELSTETRFYSGENVVKEIHRTINSSILLLNRAKREYGPELGVRTAILHRYPWASRMSQQPK